jgi:zinc protease
MIDRAIPPAVGEPTAVQFPAIARDELASGLRVWSLPWHAVPVVTVALVLDTGSSDDPASGPGLAGLAADLLDEGAGGRNAIDLSDAFARLGTHLEIDVGQDTLSLSFTTLARNLDAALALVADVMMRPHLAPADFTRVRDLRLSRLRQLSTSASAIADRTFLEGVFGAHPYGHGTFGTTRALEALTLDDVRAFQAAAFGPAGATLVVAGDVGATDVVGIARARLGGWSARPRSARAGLEAPAANGARWLFVDRPGAAQSELRIGHIGPTRHTPAYHALVALNAAIGGQFTSRINQNLREAKGYTYGARTGFDFRRSCSTFACDTSVQSDATVEAAKDVLAEFEAVRATRPISRDELSRAQRSLTRGYARHFETAAHLVRAAAELARFDLPDDTFDRFVPAVSGLTEADLAAAARECLTPDVATIVIVGDGEICRPQFARALLSVNEVTQEF